MSKIQAKVNGSSVVDLEDYLNLCLREAVDKATDKALEHLCKYIQDNWYNTYDPKIYKRTYDFLASATKTDISIDANGYISTMIFFDTNKLLPEYGKRFNAHMSFDEKPFQEKLPEMIEYGGFFYGRGKTDGLESMKDLIEMLRKKFPSMVRTELKAMGLNVRFKK